MGRIKTENFNARQNRFARFNQSLANPARIAILEFILSRKYSTASHVIEAIDLGDPSVRQHLKELVDIGFVLASNVRGHVLYRANHPVFSEWFKLINQLNWMFLQEENIEQPFDWKNLDMSLWREPQDGTDQPGSGISSDL